MDSFVCSLHNEDKSLHKALIWVIAAKADLKNLHTYKLLLCWNELVSFSDITYINYCCSLLLLEGEEACLQIRNAPCQSYFKRPRCTLGNDLRSRSSYSCNQDTSQVTELPPKREIQPSILYTTTIRFRTIFESLVGDYVIVPFFRLIWVGETKKL